MKLLVTEVNDRIEFHTLEDLVDLSLHEINGPIGLITLSHPSSEIGLSEEELNTNWPEEGTNPKQLEVLEPERLNHKLQISNKKKWVTVTIMLMTNLGYYRTLWQSLVGNTTSLNTWRNSSQNSTLTQNNSLKILPKKLC